MADIASLSLPPVKLSLPLQYQQDLFQEIRQEDSLVILAPGLGLLRIVTNLLHSYDVAGDNLVLLVGADERETGWIGEALAEQAAIGKAAKARGLRVVNTDAMTVGTREKLYAKGGIFAITNRILVVDLLTSLLDPETITGIIVLHAERAVATSLEAFILRIYRQRNSKGFLKAFSDNPIPFTTGFSPLSAMMRNLFLRKPSLWPRFHVTVAESLENKKADVIELEVSMTESMREIQSAILECIEVSISELRKNNSQLEMDDWTIDSALHRSFDVAVRRQLDPVWHRVSWKTRQIVNDLTVLRGILHCLLTYDAVAFHQYLETILAAHSPPPGSTRQSQSPWLFLDAANTIFSTAKRRVYTGKASGVSATTDALPSGLIPTLEELPKWELLSEVLEEIERDMHFNPAPSDSSYGTTLIMCSNEATCRQLREYLQTVNRPNLDEEEKKEGDEERISPAGYMMRRKLRGYLTWKRDFVKVSASLFSENQKILGVPSTTVNEPRRPDSFRGKPPPNKRRRVRGGGSAAAGPSRGAGGSIQMSEDQPGQVAQLLAGVQPTEEESKLKPEIAADPLDYFEDYFELYDMDNLVIVHPYDGDMDEHILEELKPRYVVMYEPDPAFIRRVEVYRSSHRDRGVRVYFMYYGDSAEEQRYLSAVRREKDAFTKLIKEKGTLAVTLTVDVRPVDDPQEDFLRTVNTRIAGGGRVTATAQPPRVVVDVREFRSSLPSLLHGRNMVVVPCMLTVGDYIISPEICVERKSIKDLISSFKDGRLYSQCEQMTAHYRSAVVLIEFDQNKSFTLEPFADLSSGIGQNDLQSKLVLLTLAFPNVRIIWSSSPYQTAEIFEELKKSQPEPDPLKAVKIGLEEGEDPMSMYNQTPQDILRAVPGITDRNWKTVAVDVENIRELSNMSEAEISLLVGKERGKMVWEFFNRSLFG
ncbi:DNA repair protein RAD16 [Rhizina undulata]